MSSTNDKVAIKFFFGFQQTSELKMHLNQSSQWKESKLFNNNGLSEVRYQEKDFVGITIESPVTSTLLKKHEEGLKSQLQSFCPKLKVEKLNTYLFPQLFIS